MDNETESKGENSQAQSGDVKLEDIENGNADKNENDEQSSKPNSDENKDSEKPKTPTEERQPTPEREKPPTPVEEKPPPPEEEKTATPRKEEGPQTPVEENPQSPKEDKSQSPAPEAKTENVVEKETEETQEEDDTQSIHSSRAKSVASVKEPQGTFKSRENTNTDNLSSKPDRDLTNAEFVHKLREDTLLLSREIAQWRETYSVNVDADETSRILKGEPSLVDMGLSNAEREIAGEVVRGKMSELKDMSLDELVNFVYADDL